MLVIRFAPPLVITSLFQAFLNNAGNLFQREHPFPGPFQHIQRRDLRHSIEFAVRPDEVDNTSEIAGREHRAMVLAIIKVVQINITDIYRGTAGIRLENLDVFVARRVIHEDLALQASKTSLVGKILRGDVRREDDQLVEWNLELLAGVQRQEVVSGAPGARSSD